MVRKVREKGLDASFWPPPSSVGSAIEPSQDRDRDRDGIAVDLTAAFAGVGPEPAEASLGRVLERLHRHSGGQIHDNLVRVGADHSQATASR